MSSPRIVRVPPDWRHPLFPPTGHYIGLSPANEYAEDLEEWRQAQGDQGDLRPDRAPERADYMPDWPEETATHFMLYEGVSDGTPISPAFVTEDELWAWVGKRTFTEVVNEMYHPRCVYCDVKVPRRSEYGIHRDNEMAGPEFHLCHDCGSMETPTCEAIWARVEELTVDGSLRSIYFR